MFRPTKNEKYVLCDHVEPAKQLNDMTTMDPQGFQLMNIVMYKCQLHVHKQYMCLQKYGEIRKKYKNMGEIQKILKNHEKFRKYVKNQKIEKFMFFQYQLLLRSEIFFAPYFKSCCLPDQQKHI